MIEPLQRREKALEPFGWKGREAEWIALVCLHSGVFRLNSVTSSMPCRIESGRFVL